MRLKILAPLAALAVSLVGSSAFAQEEGYQTSNQEGGGYSVEFWTDDLGGSGLGGNTAVIRGSFKPVRTAFMRPRTSFVPEMLKSVESI